MPTTLITGLMSEAHATRLADVLMEGEHHLPLSAAGAFEAEPPLWRFEAWFTEAPDLGDFAMTGERILGAEFASLRFDHKQIEDADWVAKSLEDLPPVRAGRFVVYGAHDRHKIRPNEYGLEIEASLAFGTGHHPTTLGCLHAIGLWLKQERRAKGQRRIAEPPTILDVGTGTGVLALAFAKARKAQGIAGDLDADSVRIAAENAVKSGAQARVAVVEASGTAHPLMRYNSPYPLVVANILAGPLMRLAPSLHRAVAAPGTLILSGILAWQARGVRARYLAQGFRLSRQLNIGDWSTLILEKKR